MLKQARVALILAAILMVTTGIIYPLVMTGVSQMLFPEKADGSLIVRNGVVVGSELIGQSFVDPETGFTLTGYFRSRPSAAGSGYDAGISSGSNYGPTNQLLLDRVAAEVAVIREENGLAADTEIPIDLVTASGSGLDPAISPASAEIQIARVARERGMTEDDVRTLVQHATDGRVFGVLGEPTVNVVKLNLSLDEQAPLAQT